MLKFQMKVIKQILIIIQILIIFYKQLMKKKLNNNKNKKSKFKLIMKWKQKKKKIKIKNKIQRTQQTRLMKIMNWFSIQKFYIKKLKNQKI